MPTPLPLVVTLPFPPSLNRMWRAVPRRGVLLSKVGRIYRERAVLAALAVGHLGFDDARVAVRLDVFPPDRRKRDIDNIPKAILDALTHAELWRDDEQVDALLVVRREIVRPGGRVVATVARSTRAQDAAAALAALLPAAPI